MGKVRDKTGRDVSPAAPKPSGRYESDSPHSASALAAVVKITRALSGKLARGRVLQAALREVADIVGAEGASVLLIDPDTGGMTFHIAAGPGAEIAQTIPVPPGQGICGHVARTGEPLIVNDAQNDPRLYRRVDQATEITTRNLLCLPLRSDDRLLGVLELINKHDGADFSAADLRLTEVVASQIAMALENAHLHTQIVRSERMAAIGQTVSGLAHCIKNILNGIRSGSAVVERALESDDYDTVHEGWGVVHRNNQMLGNLVLDMLSLAREAKINLFPTDVNDLADQVCQLMTERAAERGIEVIFTPADDLPEAMTDPTQFYRCLLNLVTNAVDACDEGCTVRVRIARSDRRGRFTTSITDNGSGIPRELRAKMFAEFFTTKGGKGTGLGLPVTRKLIGTMGGTITFHSVEGCGTRFVFALPLQNATAEKEMSS